MNKTKFKIAFMLIVSLLNSQSVELDNIPPELKQAIEANEQIDNQEIITTDTLVRNNTEPNNKTNIFGFDYFEYQSDTKTPLLDIPLQTDYRISFNDKLELLLTGGTEKLFDLRVDLSGSILIPSIGKISVLGLTINEASLKISNLVQKTLVGTATYLSVKEPSVRKVSIIGAVKSPGTYTVNPFISLTEAIKYAGGLEESSSLRSIEIINLAGEVKVVDLYDFLVQGKRNVDINLQNGDTVKVKSTNNFFVLEGAVNRSMKYEYKNGDDLSTIISFGLGTKREADINKISANVLVDGKKVTKKLNINDLIDFDLDSVFVPSVNYKKELRARVRGETVTNGYYEYNKGSSLAEFLKNLNFTEDNYIFYAVIEQEDLDGDSLEKELIEFNLIDIAKLESIKLKSNVDLTFFGLNKILEFNDLIQKTYEVEESEKIQDIFQSETFSTYFENLDIDSQKQFNILKNNNLINLRLGSELLYIPLTGPLEPSALLKLFPRQQQDLSLASLVTDKEVLTNLTDILVPDAGNIVSIIVPKDKEKLVEVEIYGEIRLPGKYLVSANTNLNDIYELAGGLTDQASVKGIVLQRSSLRENEYNAFLKRKQLILDLLLSKFGSGYNSASESPELILSIFENIDPNEFSGRLRGDLSPGSLLSQTVILEDKDVISVPAIVNVVTIVGEVLSPGTITLKANGRLKDYINSAGGYTEFADKNGIFVIKPDGSTIQDSSYVLRPGDTINVPKDFNKIAPLPLASVIAQVFSDIALAAASINVLRN